MQIEPINNNNPNFQALNVSSRTLRKLGCKQEDLLKNEFINKFSKEVDVNIKSKGFSPFQDTTGFSFLVMEKKWFSFIKKAPVLAQFSFNGIEELDGLIDGMKNKFYWAQSTNKYKTVYKTFKELEAEDPKSFIPQMDYIMHLISSIPNTPETSELNSYFLSVLKELKFWKPIPSSDSGLPPLNKKYWKCSGVDFSKSVALRALENNNLELLEFLKSKGENLNDCLDLLKNGQVSDEARKILEGVKRQDAKIFELENFYESKLLRDQFFKLNPDIDINSRNENGDTLAIKAVKDNNLNLIKYLWTEKDVNWNAYDANGKNLVMNAIESKHFSLYYGLKPVMEEIDAGKYSIRDYYGCIEFARELQKRPACGVLVSPLEKTLEERNFSEFDTLLNNSFSGVNVMEPSTKMDNPPVFQAIDIRVDPSYFRDMILHPSFDIDVKLPDGRSVIEYIEENRFDSVYLDYYDAILKEVMPKFALNHLVKSYNQTGELTLEEIDAVLDVLASAPEAFKSMQLLRETSFNSLGETIGHLLCDFDLDNDFDNMRKMLKIVEKLYKKLRYSFISSLNNIDQSPMSKAIEYENIILLKLFFEVCNYSRGQSFGDPVRKALDKCTNKDIFKLYNIKSVK